MYIWLAITVKTDDGRLVSYPLRISDSSSVNAQLEIKGLQVAHLCKGKKHAAEITAAWNDDFLANGKSAKKEDTVLTKEQKKELTPGFDFIDSILSYEDTENITMFESVEQAAQYLPDYKRDFSEDFPACLDDPIKFFAVWNECVVAEKIWRAGREKQTNTPQPQL